MTSAPPSKRSAGTLARREFIASVGTAGVLAVAGCIGSGEESIDYEEWEGVAHYSFEGRIQAWTGIEPGLIAGDSNPTIVLFEGETYDFSWINKDGGIHNLEIQGEDGSIVDEYASDSTDTQEDEVSLSNVVASEEMARYVCRYHWNSQAGDIQVVSG